MMKKLLMLLMLVTLVVFPACGGGGGGGGSDGNGSGGNGDSGTPESITMDQAQDILYAAYAGIGYKKFDDTTDDEILYGVLFRDLNTLAWDLVEEALKNLFSSSSPIKLQGATITWTISDYKNETSSDVLYTYTTTSFTVNVNVSIDSVKGLQLSGPTYFGQNHNDVEGHAVMKLYSKKPKDSTSGLPTTTQQTLEPISIVAAKTLKAQYVTPKLMVVQYTGNGSSETAGWEISYAVDSQGINVYFVESSWISPENDAADNRLYHFNGGFTIDGKDQYLFSDMLYGQFGISSLTDAKYLALKGKIKVPGLDTSVAVASPGAELMTEIDTDAITMDDLKEFAISDVKNLIVRNTDGIWYQGTLTIGDATAQFQSDAAVKITTGTASTTLANWQETLRQPWIK